MKKNLVLGVPSGSLQEATLALLKKIGIEVLVNGRGFNCEIRGSEMFSKAIIMRPNDLPRAVATGVVNAAITGYDMCLESGLEKKLCKIVELPFSKKSRSAAQIVVFARADDDDEIEDLENVLVSAEYETLAKLEFKKAKVMFSTGSTEIKVALKNFGFRYGVGVTETGKSLKDNGLKIVKVITPSPVVLIARKHSDELSTLGQILKGALDAEFYQLVKFNAAQIDKNALVKNLPAMEAPTISSLSDGAVAIETIVPKSILSDTIVEIKKRGGKNILIQDITVTI